MYRKKITAALVVITTILITACSPSKAPGGWVLLDTGTGDAFYGVNFVNENVGWINGHTDRSSEVYEENANANGNSRQQKADEKKGEKKDPLKENEGFEVLQTTDGGQTWKQIPDQFKNKIRSVWFVTPERGWAITIDRNILATNDGGANWSLQRKAGTVKLKLFGNRRQPETEQPEQIDKLYFIDEQYGWIWGGGRKDQYAEQPGIFLVTVDGGQNWNSVPYPFEQNLSDIFFLDRKNAWASSLEGAMYKTTDGGLNWTKIQTKLPEDVFRSIFFVDENNGWGVGRTGRIAKTTDGGRTWTKIYKIKDEFKMRDIFFTDLNRGWAVGDKGAILYTPDAGETWLNASDVLPHQLTEIVFISNQAGFAAGLGGSLLKYEMNGN